MKLQFPIVIGHKDLSTEDVSIFNELGIQGFYHGARPTCWLTLRYSGEETIPTLVFLNKNEEDNFLGYLNASVFLFSLAPEIIHQQILGRDSFFTDKRVVRAFAFYSFQSVNWDFPFYNSRFLNLESKPTQNLNLNRLTSTVYKEDIKDENCELYPIFLKPVFYKADLSNNPLASLNNNFFKSAFPLCLPPEYSDIPDNSYFSKKLSSLREEFLDNFPNEFRQTSLFIICQLSHLNIYQSSLMEGGYFGINLEPEGKNEVSLFVFSPETVNDYPVAYMRSKFIFNMSTIENNVNPIKADLELVFVQKSDRKVKLTVKQTQNKGQSVGSIAAPSYDGISPRGPIGFWTHLESYLNNGSFSNDFKNFVNDNILNKYKGQGGNNPDHTGAAKAFCEYFFRCPFEDDFKTVWAINIVQYIIFPEYKPRSFIEGNLGIVIESENMEPTVKYSTNSFDNWKMLAFRLMVPFNSNISPLSSNLLNHPNAILNNNFILS